MAKASAKHEREKNSLEVWLLKFIQQCKTNRQLVLQYVLIILVAIAAVIFVRYFTGRKNLAQRRLDDAYYQASSGGMFGSVDPALAAVGYRQLADQYNSGDIGAQARIALGEGQLNQADSQVAQKRANSKAQYNDEAVAALDPAASYNEAIATLKEVADSSMAKDPSFTARALFGVATAEEGLAAIAADDAAVDTALASAKADYQKIVSSFGATPYAERAQERINMLDAPMTVAYYRQSADQFRNMPVPPARPADESILPEGTHDNLDPSDDRAFEATRDIPATDAAGDEPADEAAADATTGDAVPEAE
ncbi:MAG: hypothetical protein IJG25_07580 [Thermoguttaceae bacterium]|nr:hypothetical protein [Thermoguttaceae bacterium]